MLVWVLYTVISLSIYKSIVPCIGRLLECPKRMSLDCLQNEAAAFCKQSKDIQNQDIKTNA